MKKVNNIVNKKYIIPLVLLLVISIGYALIQNSFSFIGLANVNGRLNIYFDNLIVSDGSVEANKPAEISNEKKLNISFDIALSKADDFYEFEVDMVNDSSVNAQVLETKIDVPTNLKKYIDYTVKYVDNGNEVLEGDILAGNSRRRVKVRIGFKDNVNVFKILNTITNNEPIKMPSSFEITFIDPTDNVSRSYDVEILGQKKVAYLDNKQSPYVTSAIGIDFSKVNSDENGKGLYIVSSTKDDKNPVYYYRGDVDNNYVEFAGYTWRILRTNPDGSTRLILDNIIGSSQYQTTNKSSGASLESALSTMEWENSIVYSELHTWFDNNITGDSLTYITNSDYVFDTTNEEWNITTDDFDEENRNRISTYFGGYLRNGYNALKHKPSILNPESKVYTDNIGLITIDEAVYAGGVVENDTTTFLTNSNITINTWTMSPSFWDRLEVTGRIGFFFLHGSRGRLHDWYSSTEGVWQDVTMNAVAGIRPVISLKAGTIATSGDGTKENPYVVGTDSCTRTTILGQNVSVCPDNVQSKYVTSESGINYKAVSSDTNGKGLYLLTSTKNDENPIYFYRGEVNNNNVLFANNCWQIVRTTETGGTKLIYNGLPDSNGKCVRDSSKNGMDRQLSDTKVFDNSMSSPANAGYMKGSIYNYKTKDMASTTYQYGTSVTYSEGVYTLTNSKEITWGGDISYNHYTCFSSGTTCSIVYYIYYENGTNVHYIELINGKKIEDALNDMLIQNNTDSSIKDYIENTWFASNMVDFDDYLEDTVWCSDLSISDYAGWNPNGGKISESGLLFTPNNTVTMECKNPSDRFTVSTENGNGKNKYKVGMITRYEAEIAGLRSGFTSHPSYLVTGKPYWTISPSNFRGSWARALEIDETGGLYGSSVAASSGIRPMISLKSGVKATSGNGTSENPYVVG